MDFHTPSRRGRGVRGTLLTSMLLVLTLAITGSGAAWGYDRTNEDRFSPGTTIADLDVGRLTAGQAVERIREEVEAPLYRDLRLTATDAEFVTTPWDLGLRVDVEERVAEAFEKDREGNLVQRVWRRIAGLGDGHSVEAELDEELLRSAVTAFAAEVDRPPVDASMDVRDGWVHVTPDQVGYELDVAAAEARVRSALEAGDEDVALDVHELQPEVPLSAFDRIVLIRRGENRLYLYDHGEIVRDYPVATGQRGHTTPAGEYHITAKRRNPSWGNPGSAWARNMPRYIPPGPNNPLGTRALNLSAHLIRIHGTPDRASVGHYASRGCVRMYREHVEELFELVDVGTPVVIVRDG